MPCIKVSLLCFLLALSALASSTIYKYKDDAGKWVFSDKKPNTNIEPEHIEHTLPKQKLSTPKVYVRKRKGNNVLIVKNPLHAPVEIEVYSTENSDFRHHKIVPAASATTLYEGPKAIPRYKYRWVLGTPESTVEAYTYRIPITSNQTFKISQSFNGSFSHSKQPSLYAVDIAMQVGTYISAARPGTVIWVKDDYAMGGKKAYFLDKANYIKVLHDDGTYALYAHLLLGSALVKSGDEVELGQKLARSGSSGYSTGPHLHFVIRKNNGFKTQSLKFVFLGQNGTPFTPKKGMNVSGFKNKP